MMDRAQADKDAERLMQECKSAIWWIELLSELGKRDALYSLCNTHIALWPFDRQIRLTEVSLCLFVTRALEEGKSSDSALRFAHQIENSKGILEPAEKLLAVQLCAKLEGERNAEGFAALQSYRSEAIAHSLRGNSRDRERFEGKGIVPTSEHNKVRNLLEVSGRVVQNVAELAGLFRKDDLSFERKCAQSSVKDYYDLLETAGRNNTIS